MTLLKCNTSYIADNSALALSQDFIERSQNEIPYFGFSNNSEFLGIKREMFIIEKNAFLLIGCFGIKNYGALAQCKNLRGLSSEGFG